jgi:AcrR family transcriptional regulator
MKATTGDPVAAGDPGAAGDPVAAGPERRAPGRPRSARADEAIIEAVLDLLAEGHSAEALSIEAVAARAGVGKATIYRRWASKDDLLIDALSALKGPVPTVRGGSVREDLIILLSGMGRAIGSHPPVDRATLVMACVVPEVRRSSAAYACYQGVIEPRRAAMREVLRRGVSTGEIRADADIEVAMLLFAGPMVLQRMLRWSPALEDRDIVEPVVDAVLAGLAPR